MLPAKHYSKLHFSLENITPDIARKWLENQPVGQRPRNLHYINDTLVPAIKEDDFMVTGNNNIVFDWSGNLMDGQHRLLAIALCGKPVTMVVARGVDPKALDKLDIGRRRTAGNVLQFLGHKDPIALAASLGWYYGFMNPDEMTIYNRPRLDARKLAKIVEEVDGVPASLAKASVLKEFRRHRTMLAGFHAAASTVSGNRADEFFDAMIDDGSGYKYGAEDPCFHLSGRLRNFAQNASRQCEAACLLVKAYNAFCTGKRVKLLRAGKDEEFPKIRGL